jgi:Fur family ferric uptake transcriptional regulator
MSKTSENVKRRSTKQRRVIIEELCSVDSHPTASEIYLMVRRRLPNVSMGTVYRNLEILETQGKVASLKICRRETHYDAKVEPHAHFYCKQCGQIYDFDLEENCCFIQQKLQSEGHRVEKTTIEFVGVCKACTLK